jgi:hypothetical protein
MPAPLAVVRLPVIDDRSTTTRPSRSLEMPPPLPEASFLAIVESRTSMVPIESPSPSLLIAPPVIG